MTQPIKRKKKGRPRIRKAADPEEAIMNDRSLYRIEAMAHQSSGAFFNPFHTISQSRTQLKVSATKRPSP